ncbi:LysR family transcriptional regulator [Sphingobium sufflavum]|uniref:LysR substrate-binding domain-containing protein n=1 Tax=Sphingobium sufflavum TaxID=1129547 RepID=UPI001F1F226C|nr:LysR substrate-binding domain-containing protein [Sphingobium sufflavum]MCE7798033.1 LysR family transcriptional regulator [Sphingobium sufflavum]
MQADQFNIRHLAAMVAVIDQGSVNLATQTVNLTQPAITQGIAKLEAQLGLSLFERRPGGMHPTDAALRLKPRVEAALRLIGSNRATAAQIRAFVALARAGSYVGAAEGTGIAVPSLHRAVADLSLALGYRLVDRRGRSLVLTRQGAALAQRLRLALAELRAGLDDLAELQGREASRLVVGAMPLSRARLLPDAIIGFRARHPEVDIVIIEGSHAELVGPLRDGEIDMMVGALRDPATHQDLAQQALFIDHPTIIARAGHPLARDGTASGGNVGSGEAKGAAAGRITASDLARYEWILPPEGTPLRQLWARMGAALPGPPAAVPIECGSVMTIRQLLIQGDFLTLLSRDQVALELDAGLLAEIGPAPGDVSRTIGITTRADWRPTRMQAALQQAIADSAKSLYS